MIERLLTLLPTPMILPPIMVEGLEIEPARGFAGASPWSALTGVPVVPGGFVPVAVSPDCAPPGCIPLWLGAPLDASGGAPILPVGLAGAPGAVGCGNFKFCGGFKLPMSCPAGPT